MMIRNGRGKRWGWAMSKPVMQREIAIKHSIKQTSGGVIYFYATNDAAADAEEFGTVETQPSQNCFRLEVDPRFNFDDVVAYIEGYGQEADV